MSIKFYLTRNNIRSHKHYGKYYARTAKGVEVTLADIEREIEHSSTATRADVKLVLQAFHDVWKRHLQQGHSVNLDAMELGRYHISVKTAMVNRPEDFVPRLHVLGYELKYTPTGYRVRGCRSCIQREVTKGCRAVQVDFAHDDGEGK